MLKYRCETSGRNKIHSFYISIKKGGELMEQFFMNIGVIIENAFIVIWFWCCMYKWELLFLLELVVAVIFEYKEMQIHYVDDKRKVV